MRILHVTRETAGDRRFGIGRSLLPVTTALQAAGHTVRYLTQEDLGPRAAKKTARLREWLARRAGPLFGEAGREIASPWAERIRVGQLAARLARRDGYDIVHLHDPWIAWGYRHASRRHPQLQSVRWGFTEHGFGSYADATREEGVRYTPALMSWARQHEALLATAAHWVIVPTAAGVTQLTRDLACPVVPSTWRVVPHARPELQLPPRDTARAALGLPADLPLVLAVGRINPVKRLDRIVQACARLQRPLRLVLLAGAGDDGSLQSLIRDAPLLQLDVRRADDIGSWLAAADVYVSASVNESFGLANLEAMVAGLPSVCTAVGGVPEVMGDATWLVPPGDLGLDEALAGAIGALLDDSDRRRALSVAAQNRGADWPTARDIGLRYEAIYRGEASVERWRATQPAPVAPRPPPPRPPPPPPPLCELPEPLPIAEARRVLVFAPHPDDECLGCGGLVARLVQQGVPVRVVLVTDGSGAGGLPPGSDLVRQDEFRASLLQLGVTDHALLGFPDGGLEPDERLFDAMAREVDAYEPNWLVGPSSADAHRDHRCVAQGVQRAARRCATVQAVLEYETWGALPASHVLDITAVFPTKMRAVAQHVLALAQMDYAQASAGLCRYRALLLGLKGPDAAAEAFLLMRRDSGFGWPAGLGRPEGWSDRVIA